MKVMVVIVVVMMMTMMMIIETSTTYDMTEILFETALKNTFQSFQGLYSPIIPKKILCLFLQDFVNLKVT